jgi:4-hydroxy-3-methylbut-2-enyl diphosphate reductase
MNINIDANSGFCWGVVRTIEIAEKSLAETKDQDIYVLGQIIHNPKESERLEKIGLSSITHEDFEKIQNQNAKVIVRAHGEPPETFAKAKELGIEIIDATCPLVTKLQDRIKSHHDKGWQIVIYGKKTHAEVIGLNGVCNNEAVVITSLEEAFEKVDLTRKTMLFSQTTMDKRLYFDIRDKLKEKAVELVDGGEIKDSFQAKDTICHYVYGREDNLRQFSKDNDVVLFVAGRNSSNGKSLFHVCESVNNKVYFIEDVEEIDFDWVKDADNIGITGATSTPQWYMELVRDRIKTEFNLS